VHFEVLFDRIVVKEVGSTGCSLPARYGGSGHIRKAGGDIAGDQGFAPLRGREIVRSTNISTWEPFDRNDTWSNGRGKRTVVKLAAGGSADSAPLGGISSC